MVQNILITGAAGYIGGSVLADFISRTSGPINVGNIYAAVRSDEQVQALSKLGVNVVQFDLVDEQATIEAILSNEIDIVVHTASSMDPRQASHLLEALGRRRKASGAETYFIHSSVTSMYSAEGGWPFGEVKDTDPIFEKEQQIDPGNPVRDLNIFVTKEAKEQGVTSFIVPVPFVYGRGSGEWRKLSVAIPATVKASIKLKSTYKFDVEGKPPAVHISDLAALYALLVEKILQKEPIPKGENGYYFAMAHRMPWWATMQGLAKGMYERGLVTGSEVKVWPSYEVAAEALGFPVLYIKPMTMSSGDLIPVNAYQLGWHPSWDEKRFLESLDDEVQAVLELDTIKVTVFDILTPSSK